MHNWLCSPRMRWRLNPSLGWKRSETRRQMRGLHPCRHRADSVFPGGWHWKAPALAPTSINVILGRKNAKSYKEGNQTMKKDKKLTSGIDSTVKPPRRVFIRWNFDQRFASHTSRLALRIGIEDSFITQLKPLANNSVDLSILHPLGNVRKALSFLFQ